MHQALYFQTTLSCWLCRFHNIQLVSLLSRTWNTFDTFSVLQQVVIGTLAVHVLVRKRWAPPSTPPKFENASVQRFCGNLVGGTLLWPIRLILHNFHTFPIRFLNKCELTKYFTGAFIQRLYIYNIIIGNYSFKPCTHEKWLVWLTKSFSVRYIIYVDAGRS